MTLVLHGVCIFIIKILYTSNFTNNLFLYQSFFLTKGGPCKVIGPFFEELSNSNTNLKFVKVDVDELEDVSSEAGVR